MKSLCFLPHIAVIAASVVRLLKQNALERQGCADMGLNYSVGPLV